MNNQLTLTCFEDIIPWPSPLCKHSVRWILPLFCCLKTEGQVARVRLLEVRSHTISLCPLIQLAHTHTCLHAHVYIHVCAHTREISPIWAHFLGVYL